MEQCSSEWGLGPVSLGNLPDMQTVRPRPNLLNQVLSVEPHDWLKDPPGGAGAVWMLFPTLEAFSFSAHTRLSSDI